jgi:hypothetical protein
MSSFVDDPLRSSREVQALATLASVKASFLVLSFPVSSRDSLIPPSFLCS